MLVESSAGWDARLALGVLDESLVCQLGLINNIPELLRRIKKGSLHWKRVVRQKNKVTDYARTYIVQMILNQVSYPLIVPSKMELGTGTSTQGPQGSDTDLWSPVAGTLKGVTTSQQYLTFYAQYICSWQTSDPIVGTWTEIGLKDANGNLWAHSQLTSALPVNVGEMLVGQWQVQIVGN